MRLLWLLIGLSGEAQAAPHGLVVHLTLSSPTTVPVVVLLEADNEKHSVEMKDDGASPDVTAGDAMYSGTSMVQGDKVKVTLQMGDRTIEGGEVSWLATQTTCDLNLKLEGENLSAEAAVPGPPVAQQPAAGEPATVPTGSDATASASPPLGNAPLGNAPLGNAGNTVLPAIQPAADNSAAISMVAGAAFLLLAGLLYLNWSGGSGSTLPPLPEPGLLGPATPSLSEGLSRWDVAQEEASSLANILLATLARNHRVLLIAPPDFQPDRVFGGPVYRASSRGGTWKKVVEGLLEEGIRKLSRWRILIFISLEIFRLLKKPTIFWQQSSIT